MAATEKQRAYSRGYWRGLTGRWPEHRPPAPPDPLVARLIAAARELRDEADSICATIDEDDDFAQRLAPRIDALDDVLMDVTAWLTEHGISSSRHGVETQRDALERTSDLPAE